MVRSLLIFCSVGSLQSGFNKIVEVASSEPFGDAPQHHWSGAEVHSAEILLSAEETSTCGVPVHEDLREDNSAEQATGGQYHRDNRLGKSGVKTEEKGGQGHEGCCCANYKTVLRRLRYSRVYEAS